jgi:TatA/E family protein of Tat protein translocase
MPFNVGPVELIIVLVIALLVIGPRRLPEMGNAVGKTIREFRKASSDISEATSLESDSKAAPATTPAAAAPAAAPSPPAEAPPTETPPAEPAPAAAPAESKSSDD